MRRRARGAFSLVEVALALGIVSFAFVGLFGLLPAGLSLFHQAMDNSVGSQIVQRLVNEAQQTDFSTLTGGATGIQHSIRYFDDQGNEVTAINDSIYTADVSVVGSTPLPNNPVPTTTASLATVTIRLASNPGHKTSPFDAGSNVPYTTYTALIAKNQ